MAITISGLGTVTGLAAGGLPDGSITAAELASGAAKSNWGVGGVLQVAHGTNSTYTSGTVSPTQIGSFDLYYLGSAFVVSCSINKISSTSKLVVIGQLYFAYTSPENGSHGAFLWHGTDSISKIRILRHDINRSSANNSSYGIALPCHEVFTGLSSGNYTFNYTVGRGTSGNMSGRINSTGVALSSDQPGQSYSPVSTLIIYEVES
jgi:hypothetical protein